jgi:hypothetical protein
MFTHIIVAPQRCTHIGGAPLTFLEKCANGIFRPKIEFHSIWYQLVRMLIVKNLWQFNYENTQLTRRKLIITWSNINGLLIIKKKDDQVLLVLYGFFYGSNLINAMIYYQQSYTRWIWASIICPKKIQEDVRTSMVVDEGLIRTWLQWTINQGRASMRLGVETPDVIEKSKWMLNPRNQTSLEGSHVFEYKSWWIIYWMTWRSKVKIDHTHWSLPSHKL